MCKNLRNESIDRQKTLALWQLTHTRINSEQFANLQPYKNYYSATISDWYSDIPFSILRIVIEETPKMLTIIVALVAIAFIYHYLTSTSDFFEKRGVKYVKASVFSFLRQAFFGKVSVFEYHRQNYEKFPDRKYGKKFWALDTKIFTI